MTYERIKTGTFRVCILLTILLELYLLTQERHGSIRLYGTYWQIELALVLAPVLLWGIYFFSLWIAKGFIGKE